MAYDTELFRGFRAGEKPLLRFFHFNRPTLTLGRLEARRLDLDSLPFPHEIRPTGGRAVLHGEGDLCYSILASVTDPLVGGSLLESYRKIGGLLAYALRGLDREVRLSNEKHRASEGGHCFTAPSYCELTLQGKKVAGGAQAREGRAFLQQGVILLSIASEWRSLLDSGDVPMRGLNGEPSLAPVTRQQVETTVRDAFEEAGVRFEEHKAKTKEKPVLAADERR
jgi:lipoate-protein ligase A